MAFARYTIGTPRSTDDVHCRIIWSNIMPLNTLCEETDAFMTETNYRDPRMKASKYEDLQAQLFSEMLKITWLHEKKAHVHLKSNKVIRLWYNIVVSLTFNIVEHSKLLTTLASETPMGIYSRPAKLSRPNCSSALKSLWRRQCRKYCSPLASSEAPQNWSDPQAQPFWQGSKAEELRIIIWSCDIRSPKFSYHL